MWWSLFKHRALDRLLILFLFPSQNKESITSNKFASRLSDETLMSRHPSSFLPAPLTPSPECCSVHRKL
jgi:hypothetical protein